MEENDKGKMHLEVIVEDTYFKPWEDNFEVEQHTNVKVKIHEQQKPTKPMVEVKSVKTSENTKKLSEPATEIVFICERVGITPSNFAKKKTDFLQVIKEYFKANPELLKESKKFISEAVTALK